jgi:hypothetical protein
MDHVGAAPPRAVRTVGRGARVGEDAREPLI